MTYKKQLVEALQKAVGLVPSDEKPKEYVYEQYSINNHKCGRMTEIKRLKPIALTEENIVMEAFLKLLNANKGVVTSSEYTYISHLYENYSDNIELFIQSELYRIAHECMDSNLRMINGSTEQELLVRNAVDRIKGIYNYTGET